MTKSPSKSPEKPLSRSQCTEELVLELYVMLESVIAQLGPESGRELFESDEWGMVRWKYKELVRRRRGA